MNTFEFPELPFIPKTPKQGTAVIPNTPFQRYLIVGVGSVGSHLLRDLWTNCTNTTFIVFDFDKVEEKNITNQIYTKEHVGMYKVDAIKKILEEIPETQNKLVISTTKLDTDGCAECERLVIGSGDENVSLAAIVCTDNLDRTKIAGVLYEVEQNQIFGKICVSDIRCSEINIRVSTYLSCAYFFNFRTKSDVPASDLENTNPTPKAIVNKGYQMFIDNIKKFLTFNTIEHPEVPCEVHISATVGIPLKNNCLRWIAPYQPAVYYFDITGGTHSYYQTIWDALEFYQSSGTNCGLYEQVIKNETKQVLFTHYPRKLPKSVKNNLRTLGHTNIQKPSKCIKVYASPALTRALDKMSVSKTAILHLNLQTALLNKINQPNIPAISARVYDEIKKNYFISDVGQLWIVDRDMIFKGIKKRSKGIHIGTIILESEKNQILGDTGCTAISAAHRGKPVAVPHTQSKTQLTDPLTLRIRNNSFCWGVKNLSTLSGIDFINPLKFHLIQEMLQEKKSKFVEWSYLSQKQVPMILEVIEAFEDSKLQHFLPFLFTDEPNSKYIGSSYKDIKGMEIFNDQTWGHMRNKTKFVSNYLDITPPIFPTNPPGNKRAKFKYMIRFLKCYRKFVMHEVSTSVCPIPSEVVHEPPETVGVK